MNTSEKIRATGYYLSGATLYIIGAINVWHAIKTAGDIGQAITGFGSLIFGSAPAYAGYKVAKQSKDGLFDPPPAPPSPLEQVLANVPAVVTNAVTSNAQLEQMKQGIDQALSSLSPAVGGLAKQVGDIIGVPIR